MKKQSNILFQKINKAEVENLSTIVKEILAMGFNKPDTKIFTTVDLWNIQRQAKSRIQRRLSF